MIDKDIITQELEKVNSFINVDKQGIINELESRQKLIYSQFQLILLQGRQLLNIDNKGTLLLEFRRFMEQLLRTDIVLCVENKYDKKITAINMENILFHLDRKYYSNFKVVSFMEIFKIETNDYAKIFWKQNTNIPPHLGVILNYVERNYNTSYRFFANRNMEYHCIYTILYQLNAEIKELLNMLNSYHYMTDTENLRLYNVDFKTVRNKVEYVISKIEKLSVLF